MRLPRRFAGLLFLGALLTAGIGAAQAQQPDPLTDFQITGHVYEPQAVPPTDARIAQLMLPQGFSIARFAEGLYNPRMIAVAADGTIYVTQRTPGNLVMLRDTDRDGVVDAQKVVLSIKDLHGIAIRGNRIYLEDVHKVYVGEIRSDGRIDDVEVVTRNLPDAGQHPNRTLAFGPDGKLYLSIGSTCNACIEPNPENATLLALDVDTGERRIFASGLRNTIGFGWHPAAGRLYGMDQGIDWLGNDHQQEELNEILENARYGWPFIYEDGKFNPQDEPLRVTQPEWAAKSRNPIGQYTAHAAAMQLAFYTGSAFPMDYRNDAFIAMHGSWNRKPSSGYEVVRAKFDSSGSFTAFEPFITGFLVAQPNTAPPLPGAQPKPPDGFIGRPTGVALARDGALLVGDDSNNMIYRVSYSNAGATNLPQKLASEILHSDGTPLRISSSAFAPGGSIPELYTDYGKGVSPPLTWSTPPQGTRAVVLMMEDPDATSPLPFVHWTLILPPRITQTPQGVPQIERAAQVPGASQGSNSRSTIGYFGPRPPAGDPPHHYHFQIFALDTTLDLPSGYNRHALLKAMEGHVLAQGDLVGTFARAP